MRLGYSKLRQRQSSNTEESGLHLAEILVAVGNFGVISTVDDSNYYRPAVLAIISKLKVSWRDVIKMQGIESWSQEICKQ